MGPSMVLLGQWLSNSPNISLMSPRYVAGAIAGNKVIATTKKDKAKLSVTLQSAAAIHILNKYSSSSRDMPGIMKRSLLNSGAYES